MRLNVRMVSADEKLSMRMTGSDDTIPVRFGEAQSISGTSDYKRLINKPSINSVVLEGALTATDLGLASVYYDTKEAWDAQSTLIAERSAVYIYSNYATIDDGNGNLIDVAGLKIGDGTSYLVDMPFVGDATTEMIIMHVANTGIHVTPQEKEFWNNKVSSYIDHTDPELLVLSKTTYEKDGEIVSI